jgi:hypothetical protein
VPSPATRALWVPLPFLRLHVVKNKAVAGAHGTRQLGEVGDARALRGSTVPERRRPAAPDDERELGVRVRGWSCHLQDPHS